MLVPPASGTIGPQIFPYLVSIFLILVSIGIMIQIFMGNLGQPEGTEFGATIDKTDFKTLLIVAGSMATYPLLIERAGFIVASTVAFLVFLLLLVPKTPQEFNNFNTFLSNCLP